MPQELRKAHQQDDKAVMQAYSFSLNMTESECVAELLILYDFIEKLNFIIKKLYLSLPTDGRLPVLVGDIRSNVVFHSIQSDMMKIGSPESFIVKGQYSCFSDTRRYNKPFITIMTEYLVVFRKDSSLIVPFTRIKKGECHISKS